MVHCCDLPPSLSRPSPGHQAPHHPPPTHPRMLQLVRQLDSGDALDVSGIPDTFLRSRLLTLFDNLVQLRKNSAVGGGRGLQACTAWRGAHRHALNGERLIGVECMENLKELQPFTA